MNQVLELKSKLAAAKEALANLDGKITAMKTRQALIAEKSAAVGDELFGALAAARTAATAYALGDGGESDLADTQTVAASLAGRKSAFSAALVAISEELTNLDEPRKAAAARVDRLTDMIYARISEIELLKAIIFIKRSHRAFFHKKTAYMSRDYFSKAVADLVHHCSHADAEKVSHELATIYELDI